MRTIAASFAVILACAAPANAAEPQRCTASPTIAPASAADAEIARRSAALAAARLSGDVAARIAHYAPDSVTMADYQPRLFGPAQAERYYRTLAARQRVTRFEQLPAERIALGADVLERGNFRIALVTVASGAEQQHEGRYMHLWRRQPDGGFRLKAEVWGYSGRIADPAIYTLGEPAPAGRAAPPGDPALGRELDALKAAEAREVQTHDVARIDRYAADAVLIPFAEPPMVGLEAIRAHLAPYIERGRGATFDSVRIWNDGYEARGNYVIEYPRFEVAWRAGGDGGLVSGSGLRVWRREADCRLMTIRQMGTHDHR